MCNPIFDYDDGDFIYQTSGNMGIDSDGDLHMRMGDNMSMDMDTGELHFNSGWKKDDDDDVFSDRKKDESLSNPIDFSGMNRADVETLLSMMPNTRYRNIIRLLYLEQKTHKEVAEALGMSMANYYNKRILAEKQYMQVCRKEEANV